MEILIQFKGKDLFQNGLPLINDCYIKDEAIKLPWQIK